MPSDDVEEIMGMALCHRCVGEAFLAKEIQRDGKRRTCTYCAKKAKSYTIAQMADRIEAVFDEHYTRTSDQPNSWQATLLSDRESDYEWERDGEPVVYAIMNAADMPEEAASDIQKILQERYEDFDSLAMGEETEFSGDTYYEQKGTDDRIWQEEWEAFERSLKSEARFFSRIAASHLASVFDGIDSLRTRDGRALVVEAGPGTSTDALYRARVFQADERLEEALCRPDQHLGSPPSRVASAGRMNAGGISVFYGASDPVVAISEVRPPVGAKVAVARFEITRSLRLLDLTALSDVASGGSVFDPQLGPRLERAMFLRSLSQRITRPVMPDDEAFDYLPTQAIADFLATEAAVPLDGIIFPSAQTSDGSCNVVLFHKAARVAELALPQDVEIKARSGEMYEEGWEFDYTVTEEVPPGQLESSKAIEEDNEWPSSGLRYIGAGCLHDRDGRDASLRIDLGSITVHHVQAVQFTTTAYSVQRRRWERHDLEF